MTTVAPTSAANAAEKTSTTSAASFWNTGRPLYFARGSTSRMMLGSGLGDELVGAAAAELDGGELDGALLGGWTALLLGRGAVETERLVELLAVGPGAPPDGEKTGGWLVTGGVDVAGTELAGAELAGTELLVAVDVGGWVAGGVELGGVELGGVGLGVGVTGTLGVGRLLLDGPGLPVLAQLRRMLSELTTPPSRAITRTWYLAGLDTTCLSMTTDALGSSKLTRAPSGSLPASRPSWRTSSTV